jgi:hypothetical protein
VGTQRARELEAELLAARAEARTLPPR